MDVDTLKARQIPFHYTSPPVCDFIFSASGETEIFLRDRSTGGSITGLTITWNGEYYRLQWDTYPGALCYTVYKLVDELDPFSTYRVVAECITDNFYDTTDPGTYVVTPITPDGEGEIPPEGGTPTPPVDPCIGNQPPTGTGKDEYACPNDTTQVDVTGNNTDPEGGTLVISSISTDHGSASAIGLVITYEPPPGGMTQDAIINYEVEDPCGATNTNAVLLRPYTIPQYTAPSRQDVCDDESLVVDVADYVLNVGAEQEQTYQVTSANIFDRGGAVVFGTGSIITYTPTSGDFGDGVLRFTAENQCGDEFGGDIDVRVLCGGCGDLDDKVTWGAPAGNLVVDFHEGATIVTSAVGSGNITSNVININATQFCDIRIVGETSVDAILIVRKTGSVIFSTGGPATFDTVVSRQFNHGVSESISIQFINTPTATGTCTVHIGPDTP